MKTRCRHLVFSLIHANLDCNYRSLISTTGIHLGHGDRSPRRQTTDDSHDIELDVGGSLSYDADRAHYHERCPSHCLRIRSQIFLSFTSHHSEKVTLVMREKFNDVNSFASVSPRLISFCSYSLCSCSPFPSRCSSSCS